MRNQEVCLIESCMGSDRNFLETRYYLENMYVNNALKFRIEL